MRAVFALCLALSLCTEAFGFSVLTHEAIVDALWNDSMAPLVLERYPTLTAAELKDAHAYAYGGSIIQDVGYYPFGSKLFSDLTHYVRSGDFVELMLRNAQDANEYAFALGALSHYVADTIGHPEATNRVVPELYPKLRRRFGAVMTYEENPAAHLETEFGFDVLQVAKGRYASEDYHEFVGFKVAKRVLEQAFADTYGIELKDVFASVDLALGTYRRGVSTVIPEMTKVAWKQRQQQIETSWPGITRQRFLYNLSRSSYEREWDREYEQPGPFARFLALLFRLIPRVGPFKPLDYRMPDAQSEHLFMKSFNDILAKLRSDVAQLQRGSFEVKDVNLDTGTVTKPGEYRLADHGWSSLLEKLADKEKAIPQDLRDQIVAFYRGTQPESVKARLVLASLSH